MEVRYLLAGVGFLVSIPQESKALDGCVPVGVVFYGVIYAWHALAGGLGRAGGKDKLAACHGRQTDGIVCRSGSLCGDSLRREGA